MATKWRRPPQPGQRLLLTCLGASGPERQGAQSAVHLGGAFTLAGAEVVVVSRHELSTRATACWLDHFMEAGAEGATVGEAVLAARRGVRSVAEFAHPSNWLSLSILGDDSLQLVSSGARSSSAASRSGCRARSSTPL